MREIHSFIEVIFHSFIHSPVERSAIMQIPVDDNEHKEMRHLHNRRFLFTRRLSLVIYQLLACSPNYRQLRRSCHVGRHIFQHQHSITTKIILKYNLLYQMHELLLIYIIIIASYLIKLPQKLLC